MKEIQLKCQMSSIANFRGLIVGSLVFCISLIGCTANVDRLGEEGEKPKVISTNTIIGDLTDRVGGDEINALSILQPGEDPHVYEPTPRDSVALEKADLIFYNGYNLEPGLIKVISAAGGDNKKLAVGEVVTPLDYDYDGTIEPDPHVWGNAQNAILMVKAIRDRLIELSPEDEAEFKSNAEKLIKELETLDIWIKKQINTIPEDKRKLVTTHDAFQYYARAYGLDVPGTLIGLSTEEKPSAQTVKNLVNEIKKTKVPAIFAETTLNPQLIKTVANEANVKLADKKLYSDSIGVSGSEADSYLNMLVTNTKTIVEALGGKYENFETNLIIDN